MSQKEKLSNKYKTLFLYISRIFFKSWTTYICFFGFAIALTSVALIPYFIPNNAITKEILNLIFYIEVSISCIGVGVQSIIKICQIFLDPERDGIEILILSKPVKRFDIWITRASFWFLFINGVAISNIIIMNLAISFSPSAKLLTTDDFMLLSIGVYFSQIIISLLLMGITLIIGYIFGNRAARSVPSTIISCSYIIANVAPFITSVVNPISPLQKINNEFVQYINETGKIQEINNKISSNLGSLDFPIETITKAEIDQNQNGFIVKNNYLEFKAIKLLNQNSEDILSKMNLSQKDKIINLLSPDFFQYLYESQKGKEIRFDLFLVSLDFINPMSGILKIARTNTEYSKKSEAMLSGILSGGQSFSRYSSYSNIAPIYSNNMHFEEYTAEDNKIYKRTSYVETSYSKPWIIGIDWVAISCFLFIGSYVIYIRRDFK